MVSADGKSKKEGQEEHLWQHVHINCTIQQLYRYNGYGGWIPMGWEFWNGYGVHDMIIIAFTSIRLILVGNRGIVGSWGIVEREWQSQSAVLIQTLSSCIWFAAHGFSFDSKTDSVSIQPDSGVQIITSVIIVTHMISVSVLADFGRARGTRHDHLRLHIYSTDFGWNSRNNWKPRNSWKRKASERMLNWAGIA